MTVLCIVSFVLYYKRLFKNEIFLNWVNSGNDISKIIFHFEGVNKIGEKINTEPVLSFSNIDGVSENEEKTNSWVSWDNSDISCPLLNNVEIIYSNRTIQELHGNDLKKLIYKPQDDLFPSQSIEILNCMNLKLYK